MRLNEYAIRHYRKEELIEFETLVKAQLERIHTPNASKIQGSHCSSCRGRIYCGPYMLWVQKEPSKLPKNGETMIRLKQAAATFKLLEDKLPDMIADGQTFEGIILQKSKSRRKVIDVDELPEGAYEIKRKAKSLKVLDSILTGEQKDRHYKHTYTKRGLKYWTPDSTTN